MYTVNPIGTVENSRLGADDDYWGSLVSKITLSDEFSEDSLLGIEEFSHVEIVYYFHRVDETKIMNGSRHPRGNPDWPRVGIFAQRGKDRPNRLGLTIARLVRREGKSLYVENFDAIDGTPVLDIKPILVEFLPAEAIRQPQWSHEIMSQYWTKE